MDSKQTELLEQMNRAYRELINEESVTTFALCVHMAMDSDDFDFMDGKKIVCKSISSFILTHAKEIAQQMQREQKHFYESLFM